MFIAKQHSAMSAFSYDLLDDRGDGVGTLTWPDFAVATNARLKDLIPEGVSTKIEIEYNDQIYEISFEYLNRDWFNNIRFMLVSQGTVFASADVIVMKKLFKRPTITITKPFAGQVIRKSSLFKIRYDVIKDGVTAGTVAEKNGLTVTRELRVDLPDSISTPIQIFILFLVINQAVR
jgi:hypothetical protein